MNLTELLKLQGLTDEQIEKISNSMKENKIYTASEENLDLRYSKLKSDNEAMLTKDAESQKLIAELQKATEGQKEIQNKIKEYEATIQKQQEELQATKTESALKVNLLSAGAKATDIDYLIYKLNKGGWKPELNDDGAIKEFDNKVKELKIEFPNQFETSSTKKFEEKKLDKPKQENIITKDDFIKMGYQARSKLFNENPELYEELKKG